jgi:peptide/nickel transport system substrate-binding protein
MNVNRTALLKPFGLVALAAAMLTTTSFGAFAFNDAPALAEAVAAGKLPPVDERLPEKPQVWADNEWNSQLGKYGGQIRVTTHHFIQAMAQIGFARITSDRRGFVPDLAESFEWNDDKTAITFHMRKGVKWSDGEPFTASDIMFWWEDIIHSEFNDKPLPAPGLDTEHDKVVMVDDYTVRFEFARPNPSFLVLSRGFSSGEQGHIFVARHFWSKLHPKYAKVEGNPQDVFRELLDTMNRPPPFIWRNDAANVPVLYPWKAVRYEENVLLEMERNPYFWSVDAEGNQLPYVDTVTSYLMSEANPEQIKLRVLAGEIDWDRRIGSVVDVPLYADAADSADLKMTFTLQPIGSMQGIYFGWNVPEEPKRELIRNVDFRRALSVAIDRQIINETAALGLGRIGHGYSDVNQYDPEIDGSYAQYDPDLANQLLDGIGLTNRDGEGYRTLPDGSPLTITLGYTPGWLEGGLPTVEATSEGWREVGIRTNVLALTHQVRGERELRGDLDTWLRPATGGLPLYGMQYGFGVPLFAKPQVDAWLEQERSGTAPADTSAEMQTLIDAYFQVMRAEPYSEVFEEGMDAYRMAMADQLYVIGVVQDLPKIFISRRSLMNVPGEDSPDKANIVLGTGDEEFPVRVFYYDR